MRARALWVKVRTAVLLNVLLGKVRSGWRGEKINRSDVVQIKFVAVSESNIREEIKRVQRKFAQPVTSRRSFHLTPRHQMYVFLTEPTSSKSAMIFSLVMFALILLSITAFIVGTLPEHMGLASLDIIEMCCQICFTLEYVVKVGCAPKIWPTVSDPLNLIDLVSIVPWYVELAFSGLKFGFEGVEETSGASGARLLRIFRLFRVVKVFRLGSRAKKIQVVISAVRDSADMFVILAFLLLLGLVTFSTLIYFAEKGRSGPASAFEANQPSDFDSIPAAFWWCLVTLMTVGYGDAVPETVWGKLVASLTMLGSVVITALPISVIGANFTQQWLQYKAKESRKRLRTSLSNNSSQILEEMYTYSQVIASLTEHISSAQSHILSEVNAVRGLLAAVLRLSGSEAPYDEIMIACRTVDVRFGKIETLREELQDMVEMYDLVSHTEFSVTLQRLKAIGNKMRKVRDMGSALDDDVEMLVGATSRLRQDLSELREIVDECDREEQQTLKKSTAKNQQATATGMSSLLSISRWKRNEKASGLDKKEGGVPT